MDKYQDMTEPELYELYQRTDWGDPEKHLIMAAGMRLMHGVVLPEHRAGRS